MRLKRCCFTAFYEQVFNFATFRRPVFHDSVMRELPVTKVNEIKKAAKDASRGINFVLQRQIYNFKLHAMPERIKKCHEYEDKLSSHKHR